MNDYVDTYVFTTVDLVSWRIKNKTEDYINKLMEDLLVKNKRLYGPFLWIGFNCLKAAEPIVGDSLLFTTRFQEFLVLT